MDAKEIRGLDRAFVDKPAPLRRLDEMGVNPSRIMRMNSATVPGYLFEYHPETRKLYVLRIDPRVTDKVRPLAIAEIVCEDVSNPMEAKALAGMWFRGFREGSEKKLDAEPTLIGGNHG